MDPLCWRIFVKNTVFTTFLLKIVMKQIITFLVYILNISAHNILLSNPFQSERDRLREQQVVNGRKDESHGGLWDDG